MSKKNAVKILVLAIILGGAIVVAWRMRQPHAVDIGERAPDFTLSGISQGPYHFTITRARSWC